MPEYFIFLFIVAFFRSIDSCSASIYLSEAGDVVYDAIWQFRANLVHELATALRKRSGSHVLVPARTPSSVVDEVTLLFHVRLVLCGIASETFHFNSVRNYEFVVLFENIPPMQPLRNFLVWVFLVSLSSRN